MEGDSLRLIPDGPGICLKGKRNATEHISRDSISPGPKFDSGTCQVQHSSATLSPTGVIWLKSVVEGGGPETTTVINP